MLGSRNRGVRRLSLVLGLLAVTVWLMGCGLAFWLRGAVSDLREAEQTIQSETEWLASYRDSVAAAAPEEGWRTWLRGTRARVDTFAHQHRLVAAERDATRARDWLKAAASIVLLGSAVSFAVPWVTTHIIAWIAAGFRRGVD